jgi:hypothetical protein
MRSVKDIYDEHLLVWEAEEIQQVAREIAREEIASLCGLVLRRLQEIDDDEHFRSFKQPMAVIFGEALNDFGKTVDEPGEN